MDLDGSDTPNIYPAVTSGVDLIALSFFNIKNLILAL